MVRNLATLYQHGRLGGTGYLSILPVDQGIEHSAAASFAKNPAYFDPANLVELALEGGCSAIATTLGGLGAVARRYAHRIPFIVKLNHNEFLHYPSQYDQVMFGSARQAADLGAVGVGATIYFGSEQSDRQIQEVPGRLRRGPRARACSPCCGATCATPPSRPRRPTTTCPPTSPARPTTSASPSRPTSSSRSSPRTTAATTRSNFGKTDPLVYDQLTTDNPIDLTRWQVVNCYAGRIGLINSGGESKGADDLAQAVRTAVINKRAGGTGLIVGRKAFQRPMAEGVELLHAVQDVFLDTSVTIA